MNPLLLLILFLYILTTIGLFKLFQKAGKNKWLALIPIFNLVVVTNAVGKPWWLIPLIFIPVIGQITLIFLYLDTINSFKKHSFLEMLFAVLFPFIWLPYLGFSKKYVHNPGDSKYTNLLLNTLIIYF